jgi:hypothetical protein
VEATVGCSELGQRIERALTLDRNRRRRDEDEHEEERGHGLHENPAPSELHEVVGFRARPMRWRAPATRAFGKTKTGIAEARDADCIVAVPRPPRG